ncbi:MAG: hypothetical protein KC646_15770 [Candidatus Cloacimonetes bacterium]|nr:hypothetical protein [Candidatus Cloacimonadota bacterium]
MNLWIESLNLGLIKRANVKLLNIISPGGMFFMIPKKKAFDKIKKVVQQEFEESVSYLDPKDRLAVLDLDIRWLGDYKRQLFNKYKAEINQSTVILFDHSGKQITRVDGYSKTKAAKLKLEVLKTMKSYDRYENKRRQLQNR